MNVDSSSVVNVKLTERGKNIAIYFYSEVFQFTNVNPKQELALKRNTDGSYSFNFSEFMQIFGGFNAFNMMDYFVDVDIISNKKNSYIRVIK